MPMTRTTRFWLYLLVIAMTGFWLNVAAIMVVATANGLGGLPRPFLQLIYVAYWPSWVCGLAHENFFDPDLFGPFVMNWIGWTVLGGLVGFIHNKVAQRRASSPP